MKSKKVGWRSLISPRSILFLVAVLNYGWFFSSSNFFEQFGTTGTKISFCAVCPWYWDWSLANLPSLSLLAAVCLLIGNLRGYLPALLLAGYEVIDGIQWLSRLGFVRGVSQRLGVFSESDIYNFWSLLDVQYFFATAIFITAVLYIVREILRPEKRVPLD